MTTTLATVPVARGQDFTWTFTLTGSSTIAGSSFICRIRRLGGKQVLLAPTVVISDAANRVVTVTLSDSDTAELEGDPNDPTKHIDHVLGILQTLSNITTPFGQFIFPVYTPA